MLFAATYGDGGGHTSNDRTQFVGAGHNYVTPMSCESHGPATDTVTSAAEDPSGRGHRRAQARSQAWPAADPTQSLPDQADRTPRTLQAYLLQLQRLENLGQNQGRNVVAQV